MKNANLWNHKISQNSSNFKSTFLCLSKARLLNFLRMLLNSLTMKSNTPHLNSWDLFLLSKILKESTSTCMMKKNTNRILQNMNSCGNSLNSRKTKLSSVNSLRLFLSHSLKHKFSDSLRLCSNLSLRLSSLHNSPHLS